MKKYILLFLFNLVVCSLLGQQIPSLTHYYLNPYLLNPAFAGHKKQAELFVHYRRQWVGVPGAPETQIITFDGPLNQERIGLGVTFYNNINHILGRTGGMFTGAYEVRFSPKQTLGFGLSLGFMQNKIFFDRVRAQNPFDQTLLSNLEQKTVLDANFGLRFTHNNFTIGLASHQLMENTSVFQNEQDNKSLTYSLVRHYTATIGHLFELDNSPLTIEPLLMIRASEGLNPQFDFNTILRYHDIAWLAATYKHQSGAALGLGAVIEDRITIGYTYEFSTTAFRNAHDNTHEISMSYRFGNYQGSGNRKVENRGISRDKALEQLKQENIERLKKMTDDSTDDVMMENKTVKTDTLVLNISPIDTKKRKYKPGEIAPRRQGYYIVIGSYYSLNEAKSFQRLIYQQFPKTFIIESQANQSGNIFYFVCTDHFFSRKSAMRELYQMNRDKIKIEEYINSYPWIYIIDEE